ncbi:MAG TPA: HAMP domain-containing sensor histidine kinase [Sedimentisphaerales bacterium]|nr:HAMP domain-containing sensor histidine kinase [Sedimentisphaerales bacterium]
MPDSNELNSVQCREAHNGSRGSGLMVHESEKGDSGESAGKTGAAAPGGTLPITLLEGLAIGVVIVRHRQGITQANYLARKLLGLPPADGDSLDDVHRAIENIGLGELLLAGDSTPAGHREFTVKNRLDKVLKVTSSTIEPGEGGCRVLTITDNTLRQQHDEAMTEFIASISHELRTPLTTIQNSVSNILAGVTGKVTPKTTQYLENMLKECGRLAGLVNDLLDMAKLETGKMPITRAPADMAAILVKISDAFRPTALEKNLQLQLIVGQDIPPVYVDPQRIHQVFCNLVKNALKYTESGGRVTIHLQEQGDSVLAIVEDTGIGIPQELLPSIFNKFYQVARKAGPGYNGCGLGLAISRELIAAHSGRIWAESQVGVGTKFFITLPKTEPMTLLRKHVAEMINHARIKGGSFAVLRGAVEYHAPLSPKLTRASAAVIADALSIKREMACGPGDLVMRTGENELMLVLMETDESFLKSVQQRLQKIMAATIEKNSFSELAIQPITHFVAYPRDGSEAEHLFSAARRAAAGASEIANQRQRRL